MASKYIQIEDMLEKAGEFGRFQWLLLGLLCIINICGSQILMMYFAGLNPPWKCTANSSVCLTNQTFPKSDDSRCLMNRNDWEYTQSREYSVTTQFDLVCGKEWLISFSSAILFLGWMIGGLVLGWIADNFGRKTVFYPSTLLFIFIGFVTSFSPNIVIFLILRFIAGFLVPGTYVQGFVIVAEYAGNKYRPFAGTLYNIFFSVNLFQLLVIAYFVREWKYVFILATAPYGFVVFLYPFIPESAKWLLVSGQNEKADKTFQKIAKWNKKEKPEGFSVQANVARDKPNPWHLFNTKEMAISTIIQGYAWMVNGMMFYGLTFAADDIGGSLYFNFFLLNIISLPAVFTITIFCERFGRKKTVTVSMLVASSLCILSAFLPGGRGKVAIVILGIFALNNSFPGIYIWSAEIFQTTHRSEGMGFLQLNARIGSAMAPFIVKQLITVHKTVPFILLGVLGYLAFGLSLYLPETKYKKEEIGSPTLLSSKDNKRNEDE